MRPRFPRPATLVVAALAAASAACDDDPAGPGAALASIEAEAVLRSADLLPSLPDLLDRVGPTAVRDRARLYGAAELWARGSVPGGPGAAARRRAAAEQASPLLAAALSEQESAELRRRLEAWQGTAEGMLRHLPLPGFERSLQSSRAHLRRADRSTRHEDRVYHLLLAAADLVDTTPRFVARDLAARAQAAVRRAEVRAAARSGSATDEPDVALERGRRLANWAARAVEEGEHLVAIQRAYYAIQLAEGR